jgi:hypothetical protein
MSDLDGHDAFDRVLDKLIDAEVSRNVEHEHRALAESTVRELQRKVEALDNENSRLRAVITAMGGSTGGTTPAHPLDPTIPF